MPSESASRSTAGGPSTAHHEPGRRVEAELDRRERLQRVQRTDLDVGTLDPAACRAPRAGRRPRGARTSAPGRSPAASASGGVGDGGVGRGDDHEVGVATGVGHLDQHGAPRRSAAATVEGASTARPATATGVQPARRERDGRRWSRRGRDPRGRAPGLRRLSCTTESSRVGLATSFQPRCGCRSTRATTNARPGRPHRCHCRAGSARASSGSRSASGTSTNARSAIRGCGTTRSGSSTRSSPTSSTSTSSVRGPQRTVADAVGLGLEPRARRSSSSRGVSVGVDRDHRVEVVGLLGPADRRGLVHRRHRHDRRRRRLRRARRPRAAGTPSRSPRFDPIPR